MATAELVLESAIDALTRRTLVVASLLGKLKADTLQAPGFGSQFLLGRGYRRGRSGRSHLSLRERWKRCDLSGAASF